MIDVQKLISLFKLEPHPEGGYFRETYRSTGELEFDGKRNYATCIYYLLLSDSLSAFHRIKQDEIWHYYDGSTVELHIISPEGVHNLILLGKDFEKNEVPQYVVPAGYWFGATVKGDFAFVGCTVSPGFDFRDFELADRKLLQISYPDLKNIIETLTR